MHTADPDSQRPSLRGPHVCCRLRAWILSRIVGDHSRVLDVLHISDATSICSVRAWDGSGGVLAGRTRVENDLGAIRFFEGSAGIGGAATRLVVHRKVTFVTQNNLDMDKISPIM